MSRQELRILDMRNAPSQGGMATPMGRRGFMKLGLGLVGVAMLGGASCHALPVRPGQERRLNFYNLPNYIAPTTIPDFEREYGIKVTYDNYSAQDTLEAKLRIGQFGYDLVVASDYKLTRFRRLGIIQALDQRRIPNLGNLFTWLREAPNDPGNHWSVPWQWGTTGVGYNRDHVKEPVRSWKVLWDPAYRGRIDMLNERRDCIAVVLAMLGFPVNSTDPRHLAAAQEALIRQKFLLKHYTSDTYIDEMASEDAWLCEGWSGDVFQAMADNPSVGYVVPEEGSFIWVDSLCIPAHAPHKEIAEEFVNYVLEPKVGAAISNAIEFATPNRASLPYIRPELRSNPLIYPPPDAYKQLAFLEDLGPDEVLWNEVWEAVKLAR